MRAHGKPITAALLLLLLALLASVSALDRNQSPIAPTTKTSATKANAAPPLPPDVGQADSSPPLIPDADAEESAAIADAIREIREEQSEEAAAVAAAAANASTMAVASEPAPETTASSTPAAARAAAGAPSPSLSPSPAFDVSEYLSFSSSSPLTDEERERKELAAAALALARSRGDAAAAAVAFARLRDADAEKSEGDEGYDEDDGDREEEERKWRPFKMRDQSEDEEEEEREREKKERKREKERREEHESERRDKDVDDGEEERREASKSSAASEATAPRKQQQQEEQPHISPPFDPRWPSPAGVAFAALEPDSPGDAVATRPPLSLSSALPPEYDASVGGRGLPPPRDASRIQLTSFAAARAAREAARRADRWGREPEDLMAAEGERPRPRRETMLTAGLLGVSKANAYGARPDDIPVVAPTPLVVSEWKDERSPAPRDGKEASRVVVDGNASSWPFELTFAANAAVDQPTRRFRPPDQSLCVGNGVVITGNNLILRTWDAGTGAPLQGPIAQPDFFGLDGNFSDPVCIYDSQDSKRFFVGVFRFGEGATKYSQFVVAVSKTSDPADGFLGPYVFRNDGLGRDGKPLPGLNDCGGSGDDGGGAGSNKSVASAENESDEERATAQGERRGLPERSKEGSGAGKEGNASGKAAAPTVPRPSNKGGGGKKEASDAPVVRPKQQRKIQPGCLGDYPAVGLDSNAFVATFNLFQTEPEEKYAGVLLLAIDKRGLLSGTSSQPAFVAYSNFNAEISYTVQPSQTQAGTPHESGRGGTIYLVSTGPCTQNEPNVNMVAAWAMTNTSALATPGFGERGESGGGNGASGPFWTIPSISKAALVEVPAYRDPGAFKAERLTMPQPEPGVPIDSGDARTLQHVLSGGVLWFAAQTAAHVGSADAPLSVAVAYWALLPSWNESAAAAEQEALTSGDRGLAGNAVDRKSLLPGAISNRHSGAFSPRLVAAGYLAPPPTEPSSRGGGAGGEGLPRPSLARPAITATRDGRAWVSALLTGPETPPTQVAASADIASGPLAIYAPLLSPVVLSPTIPDKKWKGASRASNNSNQNGDGGGGNKGGTLRGGDYGGATLDERGDVWLAGMWSGGVPSASCLAKFTAAKCPSWGTIVNKVSGRKREEQGGGTSPATTEPTAADRAASLAVGGSVIAAKGVAGPSVPGARAGEWAAKAAKAKAAMEERDASLVAPEASSPAASEPFPSAATYDPDDVPEKVSGGR